jgi:DNA-binding MarR family transcriptional regulator
MSSDPTGRADLLATLTRAMRETSAQGVLFSQAVAEGLGIASSDLECLDIVVLRGPVTAGTLAQATGLTTGAITAVIDRLEKAGYVRRVRATADRRKVLVEPLPAIEARIMPWFASLAKAMDITLGAYTDGELRLLLDFYRRAHVVMVAETAKLRGRAG